LRIFLSQSFFSPLFFFISFLLFSFSFFLFSSLFPLFSSIFPSPFGEGGGDLGEKKEKKEKKMEGKNLFLLFSLFFILFPLPSFGGEGLRRGRFLWRGIKVGEVLNFQIFLNLWVMINSVAIFLFLNV